MNCFKLSKNFNRNILFANRITSLCSDLYFSKMKMVNIIGKDHVCLKAANHIQV